MRGPLSQEDYHPQFSGHETFPLRYGWLKKVLDAVAATENEVENKSIFLSEDAIARFGVGKNMVAAMRYWAMSTGIIEELKGKGQIRSTAFGRKLFGKKGYDPYMEHPSTLWLVHWKLAALPTKTTWFWTFNHYPAVIFEREQIIKGISNVIRERGWPSVALPTIKKDVSCFIRTYVAQYPSSQAGNDDVLESPLIELGLIQATGKRDGFRFVRGPKAMLSDEVFVYALYNFWIRYSTATTLSFEAIAHEPGSPGRIFLLEENDVVDRLIVLDKVTRGALQWSETAGLKQVVRNSDLTADAADSYIDQDYKSFSKNKKRAA